MTDLMMNHDANGYWKFPLLLCYRAQISNCVDLVCKIICTVWRSFNNCSLAQPVLGHFILWIQYVWIRVLRITNIFPKICSLEFQTLIEVHSFWYIWKFTLYTLRNWCVGTINWSTMILNTIVSTKEGSDWDLMFRCMFTTTVDHKLPTHSHIEPNIH